jgi:hypothetical protein
MAGCLGLAHHILPVPGVAHRRAASSAPFLADVSKVVLYYIMLCYVMIHFILFH